MSKVYSISVKKELILEQDKAKELDCISDNTQETTQKRDFHLLSYLLLSLF
jgi:hypothetical protein